MKIGYARKSTGDQTTAAQVDALTKYGVDAIHTETGSGKDIAGRPVISSLVRRLERGDVLVVTRLDRLARSLHQLLELMELLNARGAHLVSLAENVSTLTATGKLIFHIAGVFAEFERNLLIERTHAGLEASRRRGTQGGRKPLNADVVRAIKRVAHDKELHVEAFCAEHQISRTTFYKYQALALEEAAAKESRIAELRPRGPTNAIPMLPNARGRNDNAARKAARTGAR